MFIDNIAVELLSAKISEKTFSLKKKRNFIFIVLNISGRNKKSIS